MGINDAYKRYGLKGINDDETACSRCGRVELKRVMWLVELSQDGGELGDAFPVGVICGAKMLKSTAANVNTKINKYERYIRDFKISIFNSHPSKKKADKIKNECGQTFLQRIQSGLQSEIEKLLDEAWNWADTQNIPPMPIN